MLESNTGPGGVDVSTPLKISGKRKSGWGAAGLMGALADTSMGGPPGKSMGGPPGGGAALLRKSSKCSGVMGIVCAIVCAAGSPWAAAAFLASAFSLNCLLILASSPVGGVQRSCPGDFPMFSFTQARLTVSEGRLGPPWLVLRLLFELGEDGLPVQFAPTTAAPPRLARKSLSLSSSVKPCSSQVLVAAGSAAGTAAGTAAGAGAGTGWGAGAALRKSSKAKPS